MTNYKGNSVPLFCSQEEMFYSKNSQKSEDHPSINPAQSLPTESIFHHSQQQNMD
jgi:hypothetical protein